MCLTLYLVSLTLYFPPPKKVCCVEFDRKDILMNKLVATTLESKFTVYDLRTQHPTKGFSSLTEKVWPAGRPAYMYTSSSVTNEFYVMVSVANSYCYFYFASRHVCYRFQKEALCGV